LKKLVILLVLAGAGYFGYKTFIGKSAAFQTYQKFADAMAWARSDEAKKYMVDVSVVDDPGDANHRIIAGDTPVDYIHGTNYEVESETKNADGTVTLKVKQTIFFDPPGTTSGIGGALMAIFRQTAVMRKTSEGWKVSEFDSEFIETKETRSR
jgi:uncharacterized protein (UPF0333 family)